MNYGVVLLCCLFTMVSATAQTSFPLVKLTPERMPDMNVPRMGHSAFYAGDELVVVGGHTSGFVPTATAEYYSNGEWHLLQTVYPHDNGTVLVMKSGKVLVAGGHSEPLGIGQTFTAEMYAPATHTFKGFGCLSRKRVLANAVELDSGRVLIAGNHFSSDGMEEFDGQKSFRFVKESAITRTRPLLLRTDGNDVLVFGGLLYRWLDSDTIPTDTIERLRGESFTVPLLKDWMPLSREMNGDNSSFAIGDESKGEYAYLVSVIIKDNRVAVMKVQGTSFSLLPTSAPIPMKSPWGDIEYLGNFVVDKAAKRAYLPGCGSDKRLYVLSVEYDKTPAPITLYYTEPTFSLSQTCPVLTPDGDLVLTGGINGDNFSPLSTVWLFRLGQHPATAKSSAGWVWPVAGGVVLVAVLLVLLGRQRRRKWSAKKKVQPVAEPQVVTEQTPAPMVDEKNAAMLRRVCDVMEEKRLFLNSDLRVSDLAFELGTNSSYVSECIRQCRDCSFTQFVNSYRVDYAKRLMREHPGKKVSSVYIESGFSNESSFFRIFKAHTGMTPKEWKSQID